MAEKEEFNNNLGEVLSAALHVENMLEFFISNYFIKPQTAKTFFFQDEILLKMSFEKKLILFNEICKREKFDKKEIKKIYSSIKFVQELRNRVAHWQAHAALAKNNELKIYLRKRKSITSIKDTQELNKEIMNKLDKKRLEIIISITNLYLKYSIDGTVDERH